jgi:hypothetical protein
MPDTLAKSIKMQTFLPYPDYRKSAKALDMRRLGKQRSECIQLLRGQWPNHPASKMWRGHFYHLGIYGIAICDEWIARGYKDTCLRKIQALMLRHENTGPPSWLGTIDFHRSHRSNLLRKCADHYTAYFDDVPDDLSYVWP